MQPVTQKSGYGTDAYRMKHFLIGMLCDIKNNLAVCFPKTTFTELNFRKFYHKTALRCSACVFYAQ